jgi:diguanylate cyclase (GGDEF)-like protein/PAS domain S-box-containing protein
MGEPESSEDAGMRLGEGFDTCKLIEFLPQPTMLLDCEGNIVRVNEPMVRLFGQSISEIEGDHWLRLFEHKENLPLTSSWKCLQQTGQPLQLEVSITRPDRSKRVINLRIDTFCTDSERTQYLGCAEDVTITHQLSEAAAENERRLAIMLEVMSEGVVLQDATGRIILSNPAAEKILGLTNEQMCGRTSIDPRWRSIREDGSDYPGQEHPAMRSLATGHMLSGEVMGVHKPTGELTWISINSVPLFDGKSTSPYAVVASFSDITELKNGRDETQSRLDSLHLIQIELEMHQRELEEKNAQLRSMADTDVLTGLKNRRCLFERLRAELALFERNGNPFSLVLFDIDFFKSINDTYGHMTGDDVLKKVAHALQSCARVSDFVARYGGEEFAVILPQTDSGQALQAAERMLSEVRRTYCEGKQVTASAGVACCSGSVMSIDALIEAADKALYRAKDLGRNQAVMAD